MTSIIHRDELDVLRDSTDGKTPGQLTDTEAHRVVIRLVKEARQGGRRHCHSLPVDPERCTHGSYVHGMSER